MPDESKRERRQQIGRDTEPETAPARTRNDLGRDRHVQCSGNSANEGIPDVTTSHAVARDVKTASCGLNWFGSSSADARTNTSPGVAALREQTPDPHTGQKPRSTSRPLSASDRNVLIS